MYLKCGMVKEAGREAFKAKDKKALEDLRSKASAAVLPDIENMITQLSRGR